MKLATKLIILFLLLTIIPLIIVGYLFYDNGRRSIEQDVINHLVSTNILKESEFERWIRDNEQQLEMLAQRPSLCDDTAVLVTRQPDDTIYQTAAARLLKENLLPGVTTVEGFTGLSLLRAEDGLIMLSTDANMVGKYRESEAFFLEGLQHTYTENVTYSLSHGAIVMHVSTPVRDEEDNAVAVLVGHANLSVISEIMEQRSGLSQTEDTYLVNSFNFFVTEPRFGEDYALKKIVRTEGVQECLQGKDGVGFYDNYRGVPVIGAYRCIPERQLCILTEMDQAEAYAPIAALRNIVLGVGLGVALLVALLGLFFARTITKPVRQLVVGAEEVGRGNLEYRIEVTARDEIGQLSRAFNQMTKDLQAITASRDELNREITERKKVEEERERLLKSLEEKTKELEQVLYAASHDLRSPLVNIQGFAREMEQSVKEMRSALNAEDVPQAVKKQLAATLDKDIPESLKYILTSAYKIDSLLGGLLQLSRLGRAELEIKLLNMNELMRSVIQTFEFSIKEKGVQVEVGYLPACRGDETRINQLFSNLIDNALKFLDPGRPGIIRITGKKEGGQVVYCVEDNGIGIALEYHQKIFGIFERLNPTAGPGEGLGLTIVRRILDRHNGKIWLKSEPGKGSRFFVSLPAA